jgi:hypothetical protein
MPADSVHPIDFSTRTKNQLEIWKSGIIFDI